MSDKEKFFAMGGEMGRLMGAMDWSLTPVGPFESWPQSLKTALGMVLESNFGMYLAWGPGYTQFYNDAYRPILGSTKHPAFGKSTRETFREIWDIVGPLFDGVRRGRGVAVEDYLLPLDRHGFVEECYFIFSYSPIRDESGEVGGVHVTVTETTTRVLHERRLTTLRELAALTQKADTEEAAWAAAGSVLAAARHDLPFSALYELQPGERVARLKAGVGLTAAEAPELLDVLPGRRWDLEAAREKPRELVLADIRPKGAPWPEPVRSALVLPLARPGRSEPQGFLVAGLSPRLSLDAAYRGFLAMVCETISSGLVGARAHAEERRRAEELAEVDRVKTRFFNNVSHEFRTPLTLILGPLEEIALDDDRSVAEKAEMILRNARRLQKLVNTLLDFASLDAGRMRMTCEPLDLGAATRDLAGAFRSAIERAGLEFEVDCPSFVEPAFVDSDMWEKIVLNLLSNALKFTFKGRISVKLALEERHFVLTVSDSGVGVSRKDLPKLFDRFYRARNPRSRSHEGSGIGLALSQELARLHGGSIDADGAPERGCVFTVRIPRGHAHLGPERLAARGAPHRAPGAARAYVEEALVWLAPVKTDSGGWTGLPSVLVVDDNADMREYLRGLLGRHCRVELAGDGESALAAIAASVPDLVVSDVMLPGLDGFELLRRLRAREETAALPVVLLSARAGDEARVEGLRAGADDYIVKPFASHELVARVLGHVKLTRARLSAAQRERGLREAAEHRRDLIERMLMKSPGLMCIVEGPEFRCTYLNEAGAQSAGVSASQVAGRTVAEAFPQAYLKVRPYLERAYSGESVRFLETLELPAGHRLMDVAYVPVPDSEPRAVLCMAVDITAAVDRERARLIRT